MIRGTGWASQHQGQAVPVGRLRPRRDVIVGEVTDDAAAGIGKNDGFPIVAQIVAEFPGDAGPWQPIAVSEQEGISVTDDNNPFTWGQKMDVSEVEIEVYSFGEGNSFEVDISGTDIHDFKVFKIGSRVEAGG